MRPVNLILITTLLFTSCVSTKKYSNFVKPKFEKSASETAERYSNSISFDLSNLETIDDIVKSEKLKSQFIPAILFWQWENNIKCRISPQSVGSMFKSYFIEYSETLGLSEKLANKTLEVKIEELPSNFVYANKGYTIIFIIAYTISQLEAIYPENQDFVIKYKLQENGQEIISEEIRITNKDIPLKNIWSTTGKFTKNYVEQFENNIKASANEAVRMLLDKINNTR